MKTKITFILFYFISIVTIAQTESERQKIIAATNVTELNRLAPIYKTNFYNQKAVATQKAKLEGWPLFKSEKNGGISELVRLDVLGNPIYFSTDNAGAAITTRANKLNSGGSLGLNLDGQNMTIALWDGGMVRNTHNLLVGKVTQSDQATGLSAHATHVAGTMMGNATASASAKGMASQANLLAHDWNDDLGEVAAAAANGLLVSNHSYGNNPDSVALDRWGKYDSDASEFDQIMFNAPYYQFVNSAGNSRNDGHNEDKNGYDLLSGKSTSKNGIIVAATNQVTNYTGPSSVGMSSFSSWGPTDDGRIKPDISGKGVNVRSSISSSNTAYSSFSGTSMSSPNVAGTLLLLQQHQFNSKGFYMLAATLRGLALHTADEAGSTLGPDYRFGWGLLNAEKAANLISNQGISATIREIELIQGNAYSFNIQPYTTTKALEASICWTDPAGEPVINSIEDYFKASLVNDLDIKIVKNNLVNLPWKLNPLLKDAAATKGDNSVDNIEKIEILNPADTYTVTITNKGNLANGLQKYSLIMSNVANRKMLLSTNSSLTNRVCQGTTSTTFGFQMEKDMSFVGETNFSVSGLPANVIYSFALSTQIDAGTNTLSISNIDSLEPGSYPIVITGTSPTVNSNLFFTLVVQNSLVATPTLSIPANNTSQISVNPNLSWENMGNNVSIYTIDLAKDINFTSSLQTFNSNINQINVSNLDFGSSYFWRVKATNLCGETSFSETNKFITTCSNTLEISVSNITYSQATVSWTNPNVTDIFEVLIVPQGQPASGTYTQVTGNLFIFTDLNSDSNYDAYIRSSCSGNIFSEPVIQSFSTLVNHCVDGFFRDSGGINNNYLDGEYVTTTMFPINVNDKVSVTFTSFNLENGADNLKIYNGPNLTSPLIGEQYGYTGTNSPGTVTSTHPTGKLTFLFYSDGINTAPGWTANVSCAASLSTSSNSKTSFKYFPNPASNQVTFQGKETIKSITVVNTIGQVLKKLNCSSKEALIDISDLPIGALFFKVETEKTNEIVKIIKNK